MELIRLIEALRTAIGSSVANVVIMAEEVVGVAPRSDRVGSRGVERRLWAPRRVIFEQLGTVGRVDIEFKARVADILARRSDGLE